jgi:hypothetical protein
MAIPGIVWKFLWVGVATLFGLFIGITRPSLSAGCPFSGRLISITIRKIEGFCPALHADASQYSSASAGRNVPRKPGTPSSDPVRILAPNL